MPTEYPRNLRNEYVRIALITTSVDNSRHFYSPYKFQIDNNDVKIPDQNPIYLPVEHYRTSNSSLRLIFLSNQNQLFNHFLS